jgi:hypothetical protein
MCATKERDAQLEVYLALSNNFGDSLVAWAVATPKQNAETVVKKWHLYGWD